MLLCCALCAITQTFLPESPRWLLLSGAGRAAALEALMKAEGRRAADPAVAAAGVDAMAASIAESQQPTGSRHKPSDDGESGLRSSSNGRGADALTMAERPRFGDGLTSLGVLFADRKHLQPLLVGMSLMLFQQVRSQKCGSGQVVQWTAQQVPVGMHALVHPGAACVTALAGIADTCSR
jgi:hypothetical protein